MKFATKSLLFAVLAAPRASAFAPAAFGASRTAASVALRNSRVDTSDAVQEALRISKEFGASSKEAALAWETVEEMDSSDNSAATKGSLDVECQISDAKACEEYAKKVDGLAGIVEEIKPNIESMRSLLASQLEDIKLMDYVAAPAKDSPELREALAEAKAISDEKGASSKEAAVAWDIVEEIAAAGTGNSMGVNLDEECLVETAQDACRALEELDRVMQTRSNKGKS